MSERYARVALSTIEVEQIKSSHVNEEVVWFQRLCSSVGFVHKFVRLDCEIHSAIFQAKNSTYHDKTQHIDVKYHFMRDMVQDKKVLFEKVATLKNVVDSLTMFVSTKKFSWCRESMGIDALNL